MFIEILFKMLLFKGGVLIYAEHCIYIFIYIQKKILWKSITTISYLVFHILQTIIYNKLCVPQKKENHTSLEQLDVKYDRMFYFWANYPFKIVSALNLIFLLELHLFLVAN